MKRSLIHRLIAGPDWTPPKLVVPETPKVQAPTNTELAIIRQLEKAGIRDQTYDDSEFRGADWNPDTEGAYFAGDKPIDAHPGAGFLPWWKLKAASQMTIAAPFVMRQTQDIAGFSNRQDSRYGFGCRIQKRGEGHSGARKSLTRAEEKEVEGIWAMLNRYEPYHRSMAKIGHDLTVTDWGIGEIRYEESGRPYAFRALDSSTVRKGRPKRQRADNYVCDSFVQVVDYRIVAKFHPDEILNIVERPRTGIEYYGYGYPKLQQAYDTLMGWHKRTKFNERYFENGTLASSLLLFFSDMTPSKWKALRMVMTAQVKGYENAHRMMMALMHTGGEGGKSDKVEKIDFMKTNQEMQFTDAILMDGQLISAAFGFSTPREVGVPEYKGGGTALSQAGDKEDFLMSREGRLRPTFTAIEDAVNYSLVYRYNEDFELAYVFDRETEEGRAKVIGEQVDKGLISRNEGRERMGDERIDERWFKKNKVVIPGDEKGEKQAAYIAAMSLPMPDSLQRAFQALMPQPEMGGDEMGGEEDVDMGGFGDEGV